MGADCTLLGVQHENIRDRHWMVTDSDYTFVSLREEPRLILIQCHLKGEVLELDSPDMEPLTLPVNTSLSQTVICSVFNEPIEAVDCGAVSTAWIEKFLNKSGFRIVFAPWSLRKRHLADSVKPQIKDADRSAQVAFANSTPYMIANEASLHDLNTRLQNPVTMDNFRPNIIVTGPVAFDEDHWGKVFINDVHLKKVKLCERCPQVTVHKDTGIKDPDFQPLKTLRQYRIPEGYIKACFGLSLALEDEGTVRVGDPVYVIRESI